MKCFPVYRMLSLTSLIRAVMVFTLLLPESLLPSQWVPSESRRSRPGLPVLPHHVSPSLGGVLVGMAAPVRNRLTCAVADREEQKKMLTGIFHGAE